jgi:hypothetical protein
MKQTFEAIQTASQYRGRNVYGGWEPINDPLLGQITNGNQPDHRFQAPERSNFRAHAHSVSDGLRG